MKKRPKGKAEGDAATKRILVVDDHPLVREGLATLIRGTPDLTVSAEAGSADEALQSIGTAMPDLVLLDLSLPGASGIELLKELRARWPRLRVLVLSMHEESVYAERALRAGAKGYVMKQEPGPKVVEAIRCVLRGELYVSPDLAARMVKLFVANNGKEERSSIERLSDRELQVFTHIGNGRSSQEVASKLQLSVKTVQTYREHIKRKLGLRNAADLVHHATHWVQNEGVGGA